MLANCGSSLIAYTQCGSVLRVRCDPGWWNLNAGSSDTVLVALQRAFRHPATGMTLLDSGG
jgi:hypothetical protein